NHVVVEVTIDGKPTRAIFDTGGGNVLDPAFVKTAGLKTFGHGIASGAGEGTVSASNTRVASLKIGNLELRDQTFRVFSLPAALTGGDARPVEAIVGRELLARYATRIDYDARTLTFWPLDGFAYAGSASPIPFQSRHGTPEVRATIDGVGGLFQIDTGSAASVVLTAPFVAANDLRHAYRLAGHTIVGRGVGGYTRADLARGKLLKIGDVEVSDPVLDLSTDRAGVFASSAIAGNIGNDVLSRFTLTLDYRRRVLYLEPDAEIGTPAPPNRAGMYAQNDDRRFYNVVDVVENGPAYEAGVRAGDRIVAIGGVPAASVPASAFWQLVHGPPGSAMRVTVERDGTDQTLTILLRETL
ncbi:MAG: aspartyl protease family protein, partial [Candidatus Eremiobacteraeota bacterium]|nr:aspartyl protease family protein [Candidatus Eremiobacteraeota bacterium]